jgi:HEAT repeat protein
MITLFCPGCWKEIKGDELTCPHCGADITEHEMKGFEEKLLNALGHPERETVQRAVWILGRLNSVKAVEPLIRLFEKTDNPFLKIGILDALYEIGTPKALNFVIGSIDSGVSIVRRKASELMERKVRK